MADRGMSAAVLTEVAKSQNEPFHLVEIYFTSGTAYLTDAFKDITWKKRMLLILSKIGVFHLVTSILLMNWKTDKVILDYYNK